jgi:CubicO group peptidase (beta-lactamase class C family)
VRTTGLALFALIAAAGIAVGMDRVFWTRFVQIQGQDALSYPGWVSPTAKVEGAFTSELPSVDPNQRTFSPQAIADLVAYAEQVGSFSLIVYHRGAIQFETYWRDLGPEDVTETYSMAKSVLGIMTGFAVAEGAIESIDDPVVKYVPEWTGTDRDAMRLSHVLQMQSGLEHNRFNFSFLQNPYAPAIRLFIGPDMESAILRHELDAPPGTEFTYNSANSQLMMLILTRATGRPYWEYVSEKLWQPLGAKDATLWLDHPGGLPKGYSFFQARPRDWLRIGITLLNGGRFDGRQVIPEGWVERMRTPSQLNPKYGLQTWIGSPYVPERFYNKNTPYGVPQEEPFLADDVFFFDGGGAQRVYMVPSADLVIVRTGLPSAAWDDGVMPNILLRDLQKESAG